MMIKKILTLVLGLSLLCITPVIADGLDADTALLMHMDGADNGTTFSDSSTSNNKGNATVYADAVTKTGTKKWGTASGYFDGNADYLSYADDADWHFVADDTQDYTIDFWAKFTDHTASECFLETYNATGPYYFDFRHNDGTGLRLFLQVGGSIKINASGAEITDTDWHHIAICKVTSGGPTVEWGVYLDGTQTIYGSDNTEAAPTSILSIGADVVGNSGFAGNIDEFRIQKSNIFGAAPNDTPNDTITVPTAAYSEAEARRIMNVIN